MVSDRYLPRIGDAELLRRQEAAGAFDVKLGAGQVDNAAQTLLKFRGRLDLE